MNAGAAGAASIQQTFLLGMNMVGMSPHRFGEAGDLILRLAFHPQARL